MKRVDDRFLSREERMATLGAYLRERRMRKGMSLREVAKKARVAHTTVSRTERGKHLPMSLEQLLAYAQALELSSEERRLALEFAGYSVNAHAQLPAELDLWRDYEFLSALYEDAKHALETGDYQKGRLYLTKIVLALHGNEEKVFSELHAKASLQLSKVFNLQDEPGSALGAAHEAQKIARQTDNLPLDLEATQTLGVVLHKLKLDENALACYGWTFAHTEWHAFPDSRRALLFRDVATAMINLREFDEVYEPLKESIAVFEKIGDISQLVNLREVYGRSLATEFRLSEAESEIESLWNWIQGLHVSPLERVRVLVILFKVHALKGDVEKSTAYYQQILKLIEQHGLFVERHCLESIAHEVVIYRGDTHWLNLLNSKDTADHGLVLLASH